MQEVMFYASSTNSCHTLTVQNAQLRKEVHPLTEELSQRGRIWRNFNQSWNSAKTVRRQTLRRRMSESIPDWIIALTFSKRCSEYLSASWAYWMCTAGVRSASWSLLPLARHMYVYAPLSSTQTGLFVCVERTWRLELFLFLVRWRKGILVRV
jgi:hypothetical protein